MKQTAIEWLINKLKFDGINVHQNIINQAKEMEKKQITDAYSIGIYQGRMDKYLSMDQYYIENFKKD